MRIEQSFTIARPPAEVFAYLTDPDKLATGQPTTVEVRRQAAGPLSLGERFAEVHALMGRRLESTFEVAEYDPPRAFGLRALDGPIPLDGRWRLEGEGDATRVGFVGERPVRGPLRPFGALLQRSLDRRSRGYHATLKALLER